MAECGGFMYLHEFIQDKENKKQSMTGVIPAGCHDTGKLVRFGYIEIKEKKASFLPEGQVIRGHEFHYFDSEKKWRGLYRIKAGIGKNLSVYSCRGNLLDGIPTPVLSFKSGICQKFCRKSSKKKRSNIDGEFISFF